MSTSSISATITDRGLGLAGGTARPICVVGCSSSGTAATPTEVVNSQALTDTFGHGPGVEAAAKVMSITGAPLIFCRTADGTAGSAGSVTRTGTGADADAWAMTVGGTPNDGYSVKVKVTRYGATLAALTACVRISIDGGTTYQPEVPVPADGAIVITGTGLTITFDDGTAADEAFVDDVYAFTCTAPVWSTTTLGNALTALEAVNAPEHDGVLVVGNVTGATISTVKTSHDNLIAASRSRWFLCNARDQNGGESVATWVSVLVGASPGFNAHTANLMAISAAWCDIDSAAIGGVWRRPVSWLIAARFAKTPYAQHPGRARTGPLEGVRDESLHHDFSDATVALLDTRRFIGAQTVQGLTGYYATDRSCAAAGSDFDPIMNGRVICFATARAMAKMAEEVNEDVGTNADGTIASAEADALDQALTSYLVHELVDTKLASAAAGTVNRSDDIITTPTLRFQIRIRPRGYAKNITLDLGFALQVGG